MLRASTKISNESFHASYATLERNVVTSGTLERHNINCVMIAPALPLSDVLAGLCLGSWQMWLDRFEVDRPSGCGCA